MGLFIEIDNVIVMTDTIQLIKLESDLADSKINILLYLLGAPKPITIMLIDLKLIDRYEEIIASGEYNKYKFIEKLNEEIFSFLVRRFPCNGISIIAAEMANGLVNTFLQGLSQKSLHEQTQE